MHPLVRKHFVSLLALGLLLTGLLDISFATRDRTPFYGIMGIAIGLLIFLLMANRWYMRKRHEQYRKVLDFRRNFYGDSWWYRDEDDKKKGLVP